MFQEMPVMSSGGGGNGYVLLDDVTSVECVSSVNMGSSTGLTTFSLTNIPKTQNVLYFFISQPYYDGTFTVGQSYNLTNYMPLSSTKSGTVLFFDDTGIAQQYGFFGFTLSGTTLTSTSSTRQIAGGLFVIGEK